MSGGTLVCLGCMQLAVSTVNKLKHAYIYACMMNLKGWILGNTTRIFLRGWDLSNILSIIIIIAS